MFSNQMSQHFFQISFLPNIHSQMPLKLVGNWHNGCTLKTCPSISDLKVMQSQICEYAFNRQLVDSYWLPIQTVTLSFTVWLPFAKIKHFMHIYKRCYQGKQMLLNFSEDFLKKNIFFRNDSDFVMWNKNAAKNDTSEKYVCFCARYI